MSPVGLFCACQRARGALHMQGLAGFCAGVPLQQSIKCAHEDTAVAFLLGQLQQKITCDKCSYTQYF